MSFIIDSPELIDGLHRIANCHASVRSEAGPTHLRVFGQSGVGKSFLLKSYLLEHPGSQGDEGHPVKPVLLIPVPSDPTVKSIYLAVLKGLGISGATGTKDALRHRVETLVRLCGVELLMFDEINHITDRGQLRSREVVADTLKELMEMTGLPTVLAGAMRSSALFEANIQLRSRVTASLTLRPYDTEGRFGELECFIRALAEHALEEAAAQWLSSPDLTMRIFYATDGVQRLIARLIYGLAPMKADVRERNLPLLARQFVRLLWETAPRHLNPFEADFQNRRLNRRGEPYCPTALDGDNHADITSAAIA